MEGEWLVEEHVATENYGMSASRVLPDVVGVRQSLTMFGKALLEEAMQNIAKIAAALEDDEIRMFE